MPPSPRGLFAWLRRIPAWGVWLVALVVAFLYVLLFYHTVIGSLSIRWKALYGSVPEPDAREYTVRGIDISHYQSQISWPTLNEANIQGHLITFVFIKATEGTSFLDKTFTHNFAAARDNGYIRGAYHYFRPDIDALRQAEFFIQHVPLQAGDLPPVLDVEEAGSLTAQQLAHGVSLWLRVVETYYGVKPIIYTGLHFRKTYLDNPIFDDYPFWIAHYYREKLDEGLSWLFWQYNDCGIIDGIQGSVDFDIFNGTVDELRDLTLKDIPHLTVDHDTIFTDTLSFEENEEEEGEDNF